MDGNGRWAQKRDLPRLAGHREGAKSVRDIVRASRQLGLGAVTLYAFSSQNWARPPEEVRGLMELLRDYLEEERPEIMDNGIQLRAIGQLDRLPSMVRDPLSALIADSAHNSDMILTLALSYGGRESIAAAAQRLARKVAEGSLRADQINPDCLTEELPTSNLPALDLVIRTSGEQRISNFLLWEAAYAEFVFAQAPWPEFRRQHLYEAIETYSQRERRFGLTGSQLSGKT